MAHYRKIDTRIWNDEKFRELTDNGKLVFFFLLTHPNMTAIGAMRASIPGLAAELKWTPKAFGEAFGEALSKGMAKHDENACVVWLPNFIRYNPPESPNVLKAWAAAIDLLPECELTSHAIQSVKAFAEGLTEGFVKALPEAFAKAMPKTMPNQEQEQEQEKAAPQVAHREVVEVPDWVPSDAWLAFAEMRRKIRAPLTDRAKGLAIAELGKLRDQGHSPREVLEQSVLRGWRGLFAPRSGAGAGQTLPRYE